MSGIFFTDLRRRKSRHLRQEVDRSMQQRQRQRAPGALAQTQVQLHQWTRLQHPFTAANGFLTANGRPRRDAIVAQYHAQLTESVVREESAS